MTLPIIARKKLKIRLAALATTFLLLQLPVITLAQTPTDPGNSQPMSHGQKEQNAVRQAEPPVNNEVLKIKLPRAKESTLKNGLRVVVLEGYDRVPTFTMQMVILSGGLSDPPDHRGLAKFTAALLREGAGTRTAREVAEEIDTLGATVSAESDLSSFTTTVTASGLVNNLDKILAVFADVIRSPKFLPEEVEKYKSRTISELESQRADPSFLADERFSRAIYGHHPAGFYSAPIESLKKTTAQNLARFHSKNYLPNNAILAVVGQATLQGLLPKIERAFGSWKAGNAPKISVPLAPDKLPAKIHLVDRPGSVQTTLQLGNLSIKRTDPDYFPLLVMDKIVGGGPEARLFSNLREAKGYTYGAYSALSSSKFRGTWQANAKVRTEVTDGAMKEFLYELRRMRDDTVPPGELENGKRALVGRFALSLELPEVLLQNVITQKLYDLPADYWDTYPQHVAAISAEDVRRVARKYINLGQLQIVAVGDASRIQDVMQKYGTVEIYDSEGKPIPMGSRSAPQPQAKDVKKVHRP